MAPLLSGRQREVATTLMSDRTRLTRAPKRSTRRAWR